MCFRGLPRLSVSESPCQRGQSKDLPAAAGAARACAGSGTVSGASISAGSTVRPAGGDLARKAEGRTSGARAGRHYTRKAWGEVATSFFKYVHFYMDVFLMMCT